MVKKGDTLIEVTLAVGIFSMIAIAIVAVMNSGTSGAQTALETTLTREEIDAQAEALRFIQNSYISDQDVSESDGRRYGNLWNEITGLAIDYNEDILQSPNSCSELYKPVNLKNAFIINPQGLSTFGSDNIDQVLIKAYDELNKKINDEFSEASTYPHLIFENGTTNSDSGALADETNYNTLKKAEGIYVIPVKDNSGTNIINGNPSKSAFYDFYIRTCWYGSDDQTPSTISTVIRLYNPEATN